MSCSPGYPAVGNAVPPAPVGADIIRPTTIAALVVGDHVVAKSAALRFR